MNNNKLRIANENNRNELLQEHNNEALNIMAIKKGGT